MKVKIENQGNADIRVIIDHDTVADVMLEPAAAETFESDAAGIIELRELENADAGENEET